MKKQIIGIRNYLYTFENERDFEDYFQKLKTKGNITQIFINNKYAFEIKLNKKI